MRFKMVFPTPLQQVQQVKQVQPKQVQPKQVKQVQQVQPKKVRFQQVNQAPPHLSMKGLFVKTASCKACSRK